MLKGVYMRAKQRRQGEFAKEIIKSEGELVIDWIWKLCNMAFESVVVSEDWRFAVHGQKGED